MGHDRVAEWLIRKGADITRLDVEKCTPLHWAAIKGAHGACRALIRNGASNQLDWKDMTDKNPIELAEEKSEKR